MKGGPERLEVKAIKRSGEEEEGKKEGDREEQVEQREVKQGEKGGTTLTIATNRVYGCICVCVLV